MDGLRLTIVVDLPGQKELSGVEWTVVESDLRAVLKDSTNKARSPLPLGGGGIAFDTFICSYDNHIVCNR